MALELVTGYQGKDHVTAAQDSDLQRGICGDSYRLGVGNQMEVEAVTANELRILDGVCVLDGREFYIQYGNSETIDIESGTSGLKRNDLICIQYDRDEDTGVETGSFVVIQGLSGETAVDPSYTDNDIRTGTFTSQKALARVRLDGINIEGIDMLIDVLPSLSDLNTNLGDIHLSYYFTSLDELLEVVNANMDIHNSIPMVVSSEVSYVLTNGGSSTFLKGLLFPMTDSKDYFDFMLTRPNYIYLGRYNKELTTCNRISGTSVL